MESTIFLLVHVLVVSNQNEYVAIVRLGNITAVAADFARYTYLQGKCNYYCLKCRVNAMSCMKWQ